MDKSLKKQPPKTTINNRYLINSKSILREAKIDDSQICVLCYQAKDTRLDMDVTIFQSPCGLDAGKIVNSITDSADILDYFEYNESLFIISSKVDITSPTADQDPLKKIQDIFTKKVIISAICSVAIISAIAFFAVNGKSNNKTSDNQSVPEITTETEAVENSTSTLNGATIGETTKSDPIESDSTLPASGYEYDEDNCYRIVMYPKNEISSEEYKEDIEIIKKRFDALCKEEPYEIRETQDNICIILPVSSVEDHSSLEFLLKYFIAPKFELLASRFYYDQDNNMAWISSPISRKDIENVSILYHIVDEKALTYFDEVQHDITDFKYEFPYTDYYPCVKFKLTDEYAAGCEELKLNQYPFVSSVKDANFTVGEMLDNQAYSKFQMIDVGTNEYLLFMPALYTYSEKKLTENALDLIITAMTEPELHSNYYYSVSANDINWETKGDAANWGENQCNIEELSKEYCYAKFRAREEHSAGQNVDMKKIISSIMDSLDIPYALGSKVAYYNSYDSNVTYYYIACGYKRMGIPIMKLIEARINSAFPGNLYNGYYHVTANNFISTDRPVLKYESKTMTFIPGQKYCNTYRDLVDLTISRGQNTIYYCIDTRPLFKADMNSSSEDGIIKFDQLAIVKDSPDWMWDFAEALINAPNAYSSISFEGFELTPLQTDMDELIDRFEVKTAILDSAQVEAVHSICPDATISYSKKIDGNIYYSDDKQVYIDLNLDIDDNFAEKSTSLVKEITEAIDFAHNNNFRVINFNLTPTSTDSKEHAIISVYKIPWGIAHNDMLDSDSISADEDTLSFDKIIEQYPYSNADLNITKLDYESFFVAEPSEKKGLINEDFCTAGFICGGRLDPYIDDFKSIITSDEWFKYDNIAGKGWAWNHDYYHITGVFERGTYYL